MLIRPPRVCDFFLLLCGFSCCYLFFVINFSTIVIDTWFVYENVCTQISCTNLCVPMVSEWDPLCVEISGLCWRMTLEALHNQVTNGCFQLNSIINPVLYLELGSSTSSPSLHLALCLLPNIIRLHCLHIWF